MTKKVKFNIYRLLQLPKLLNSYFPPGYSGFVPGMKSENPYANDFTRLAKEKVDHIDKRRFTGTDDNDYKEYISKFNNQI